MKKLIAIILCLALLPTCAFAAFPDLPSDDDTGAAITRLAAYGVLCGDENGNFNPNENITRAQFAKIATVIAKLSPSGSSAGLFSDLNTGYWANGYITAAAKDKLILGYPDGTFCPDNIITLAEAITITLRLLGYTTDDLGNNYPEAYIAKANELKLCDGIGLGANDIINRAQTAVILDRALLCDINSTSGVKHKLITKMDYSVSEECIILAVPSDDNELLSDEISTSAGVYKTTGESFDGISGKRAKLVTDTDGRVAGVVEIPRKSQRIAAEGAVGNDVTYRENGVTHTYTFNPNALVYHNSRRTTYAEIKSSITAGMIIDIFYTPQGSYDYAILTRHELSGPTVVYSDADKYALGTPVRVVRDGYSSNIDAIEKYDVLYFDAASETLYAYCDRVTGVYEKALPSKADITSITLSGREYALETKGAALLLGEYDGAYAINDRITCLLGRDGEIAAVLPKQSGDNSGSFGVLLSCSSSVTDGTKKFYVSCLSSNGILQEFETLNDESEHIGKVMQYNFDNGILKPSYTGNSKISGNVVPEYNLIGGNTLSSSCKIIDIGYIPKSNEKYDASACVIEISDIKKPSLSESDVVFASVSNGKINALFLNDITSSAYSFGVVTAKTEQSTGASYTIDINGREMTYTTDYIAANIGKGTPVAAMIRNSRLVSLTRLNQVTTNGSMSYLDNNTVIIGNSEYQLAKNASFYLHNENGNRLISTDDLKDANVKSITLYTLGRPSGYSEIHVGIASK